MASTDLELIIKARDEASKTLGNVSKKAGGLANVMGKAVRAGALAGGVAIAGLGVAALKMGLDFEKSMAEVKTLLPDISEEGFGALKDGVLDLSKELGIATSDAVPALYQAISAGVPPDNVLDFMRIAGKAAIGGVTDLETAVDGITSVVNAYGDSALSAGATSDVMFTAVRLGKTNFEELSASLFNVIPTAASLGVGFEDVAAAMAVMTAQGVPTSVATTQLRQALVEASKGGTKLDLAIRKMSGQSFAELVKAGGNVQGIFEGVRGSMPEQEFKDLFGSVEAMNAVLQITGPNADSMRQVLAEMGASAGATEGAFDTMAETASFKLKKAINILKVELTKVGVKILPLLTKGLEKAIPFLEENLPKAIAKVQQFIADARPTVERFLDTFTVGLDVLRTALEPVFNFIISNKPVLIAAIAAIGIAILLAFGPAAIAVVAIIGFIALLGLLRKNWDTIKETVTEAVSDIITTIREIPVVGRIFEATFDTIRIVVETAFALIKNRVETAINAIRAIIDIVLALIRGDFGAAWEGIKRLVSVLLNGILTEVRLVLGGLAGLVKVQLNLAKDAIVGLGRAFGRAAFSLGRSIIGGLKSGIETGLFLVKGAINAVVGIIERGINTALDGVADNVAALKKLLDAIPGPNPLGNTLQSAINSLRGGVSIPRLTEGAFIPPGVVTPAILHGGKHGEIVAPLDRAGIGATFVFQRGAFEGMIQPLVSTGSPAEMVAAGEVLESILRQQLA